MVEENPGLVPEETLRRLLKSKSQHGSKELALDIAYFNQLDEGHKNYTHEYLLTCMKKHIERKIRDKGGGRKGAIYCSAFRRSC